MSKVEKKKCSPRRANAMREQQLLAPEASKGTHHPGKYYGAKVFVTSFELIIVRVCKEYSHLMRASSPKGEHHFRSMKVAPWLAEWHSRRAKSAYWRRAKVLVLKMSNNISH